MSNSNNDGFFGSAPGGFSLGGPGGFLASIGLGGLTLNTTAKPVSVVKHTKSQLQSLKSRIEGEFDSEDTLKSELLAVLNELLRDDMIKDASSGIVIGLKTYKNTLEKGYQIHEIKSSLLGDLDKMIEAAEQAGGRRKKRSHRSSKHRGRRTNKRRTSKK